MILTEF